MINHCQNGVSRRAWLRTLGWQVRPTLRRAGRRICRGLKFAAKWIGIGFLFAAGVTVFAFLFILATNDQLTRVDDAKPSVSAPAKATVQQLRRST